MNPQTLPHRIGSLPIPSLPMDARQLDEVSDETLMAGLAQSQPEALEALFGRYAKVIAGVIYNVVRDETEAEEVLNEVFLHSWNNAAQYSPDKGKALGWLVTMARRRGIDRLRKRQRYARATERLEVEVRHDPEAWVGTTDTVAETEQADIRELVHEKLAELPKAQREAIELSFFKGLSQREIAAQTGIPLGTVKTRIELGLRKLSAALYSIGRETLDFAA